MRAFVVAAALGAAVFTTEAMARAKPDEAPVSASEREAREKSRAAFRAGVGQLQAKDWKAARSSFEAAWSLYPLLVFFVIVVTANHYWFDAACGAAVACLAAVSAHQLARLRPAAWSWRDASGEEAIAFSERTP